MFDRLKGLIGDPNERDLKRLQPLVAAINALEPTFSALSDAELRARTDEFRARRADDATLDDLLPEAFAAVREAARRAIGQRHFDVQLLGGIVLHQGKIAEMKTGEGKTLVATLPAYLNALTGDGVHIITVNDYLAKRDPQWMGPIFDRLGVSVASIQHESAFVFDPTHPADDPRLSGLRQVSRQEAYRADITYGTNNEFGFDYLRDNMVTDLAQRVQRPLNYAIVDEVDNILIDEARTPLIISGAAEDSTNWYQVFARLVPRLRLDEDYALDERARGVSLTESGVGKLEKWLNLPNLYDPEYYGLTHYVEAALKAHVLYKRDRDYVVRDGEVVIVDEFTGRLMLGRRYSDGLHQAIEAQEGVKIQRETVTLATITFQNYFRLYHKLAGMTGTAATESEEFAKIYKLDVAVIPTNQPMIRTDNADQVYKTEEGKYRAVVAEIEDLHQQGRPVLVGTVSIEKSEHLSDMLRRRGVPHEVLNAKFHEREAAIIAQAGRIGAVTIATNMAGRGTDIILGGNPADRDADDWAQEHQRVVELGGLHIVGTERHEARRIDNQLRGRAGRQGDPGSSRFYASLEDDIIRRFGGDRVKGVMEWAGLDDDTPIEHPWISKAIENAQVKVEAYNFDIRKHLVDYDDVMNLHRDVIYGERNKVLIGADLKANIQDMIHEELEGLATTHLGRDGRDPEAFVAEFRTMLPLSDDQVAEALAVFADGHGAAAAIDLADEVYEDREREIGADNMRLLERLVMLRTIDNLWVQHLTALDAMRQGIGLRAVGQQDPLVTYKREAHSTWNQLLENIRHDVVHTIYHVGLARQEVPRPVRAMATATNRGASREPARAARRIGRNDPCPCGSGKKYKRCCGRNL